MTTDDLDETIEETFPASDAPANTPETGIVIAPDDAESEDADDDDEASKRTAFRPAERRAE